MGSCPSILLLPPFLGSAPMGTEQGWRSSLSTGPHQHLRGPVPQKNDSCAFPEVPLNDRAVFSELNELKEISCWERLLISYQQLTSFVLDPRK